MPIDLTKSELDLAYALINLGVKSAGIEAITQDSLNIRVKFLQAAQEGLQFKPSPTPIVTIPADNPKEPDDNG